MLCRLRTLDVGGHHEVQRRINGNAGGVLLCVAQRHLALGHQRRHLVFVPSIVYLWLQAREPQERHLVFVPTIVYVWLQARGHQRRHLVFVPTIVHEDIRDAILSLVNMFRDMGGKLERHEHREKQLGDQVKKSLSGLDKKIRASDLSLETISRSVAQLGERLQAVEASVAQTNDQERLHQQKTADALEHVQGSLHKMSVRMEELVLSPTGDEGNEVEQKRLDALGAGLTERLDRVAAAVDRLDGQLARGEADKEEDGKRYELSSGSDMGIAKLEGKVMEVQLALGRGQEEILKSVTDTGVMSEALYADVTRSYDQLLKEVQGLAKVEQVLLQTADNVLDTKRRIEYGVHQILLEVGDLVKIQGKDLNDTVNRRFDNISSTILDNQNGAMTNLSSKIETEISQVWRQIGIMYQQLTASAGALDRLQMQTEIYVNGSLQTMDSMEGKVGQIKGRILEVDDNLNFLLGKLSLVTQEFNDIKSGLAAALDNIRGSFLSVQNKIKEVGPGPNPIPEGQGNPEGEPGEEENQVLPFNVDAQ
ncbi:unnamed protein product [Timema podura]|uniref:Uncharacterized protein n=2 Tax=Timema TaxID=61471 RepID=A0ABN7NNW1_TIMPD|nr:unnamed protein product [Timema podura]